MPHGDNDAHDHDNDNDDDALDDVDVNAPPERADDDLGMPTSVGMSPTPQTPSDPSPETPQNATSNANVQNEPISDVPHANDDANTTCVEQAARMTPVFVSPTPLGTPAEDPAREGRS